MRKAHTANEPLQPERNQERVRFASLARRHRALQAHGCMPNNLLVRLHHLPQLEGHVVMLRVPAAMGKKIRRQMCFEACCARGVLRVVGREHDAELVRPRRVAPVNLLLRRFQHAAEHAVDLRKRETKTFTETAVERL